jgi:hypothetical protein
MARTNLHELATSLLDSLSALASNGRFEGKLRTVAAEAGLNSVRSAEAIKLLEEIGRIEVVQRGRRGRDTIIAIKSTDPVRLEEAETMLPSRAGRRTPRLRYDDIGKAVVDRLLEISRDDALRAAQVDAFDTQSRQALRRVEELEAALDEAQSRETDLRIKLKAAQEALDRAEENLRRAMGPTPRVAEQGASSVDDDDARAVLDILRSGRV